MTNETLDMALRMASWGFSVFPLKPRDKRPHRMLGEGGGFHHSSTDPDQIRAWFDTDPNANVGISTHHSDLVVLDFDRWKGKTGLATLVKLQTMFDLSGAVLAETWSGGRHLFFRQREGMEIRNAVDFGGEGFSGIDSRGTGGYVVAPPSGVDCKPEDKEKWPEMPDSGEYFFEDEELLDAESFQVIPEDLARWCLDRIERPNGQYGPRFDVAGALSTDMLDGEGRNNKAAQIVGSLLAQGTPPDVALGILEGWNNGLTDSLDPVELHSVFQSILRKDQRDHPARYGEAANKARRAEAEARKHEELAEELAAKADQVEQIAEQFGDPQDPGAIAVRKQAEQNRKQADRERKTAETKAKEARRAKAEAEKQASKEAEESRRNALQNDLAVSDREEVFSMVSSVIGLVVSGLVQVGPENSQWLVQLGGAQSGSSIQIESTEALMAFGRVAARIAEVSGVVPDPEIKKEWPDYLNAMLRFRELVDPNLSANEQTRDLILAYLDDCPAENVDGDDELDREAHWTAVSRRQPFEYSGWTYLHAVALRAWCAGQRIPDQMISNSALRAVGLETKQVTVRRGGQNRGRMFWRIESDVLRRPVVEGVMPYTREVRIENENGSRN